MRFTQVIIGVALLFSGSLAMAQNNIAILNVQGVVLSSNMANDFRAQLERDMKPRQDALKAQAEALNKLREEGVKGAEFLSEDRKRELAVEYGQKMRDFQRAQEEMNREQGQKEQTFVESVRPKLDTVVNRIVESRNVDLLLDRRMVLFAKADANLDISQEVLDALNAAN